MSGLSLLNWAILLTFLGGLLAWVLGSARPTAAADREALFFRGADPSGRQLGGAALTATLLISWIFAKSVQNAADLGQSLGLPGGWHTPPTGCRSWWRAG